MTSIILMFLAVLVVWLGVAFQIKLVWEGSSKGRNGAFLKNHLTAESYIIGLLWPIFVPFIMIIGTISIASHHIHNLSAEPEGEFK